MTETPPQSARVVPGLGWPATANGTADEPAGHRRRTGLGWPQDGVAAPEAVAQSVVPRETTRPGLDVPPAEAAQEQGTTDPVPRPLEALPPPDRTRVLVVANQKGGVGKTTTAVNVAAALALGGQRVLVVDLDPQGNASTALGLKHSEGIPGTYESLVAAQPLEELIVECPQVPGLFGLPATPDLAGAEIELVSMPQRESRLRHALRAALRRSEAEGTRFDYVFLDCPPSLGLLTVNALVAAEEALIPIQCEYYALEGLGQLTRTIERIKAGLNPQLQVGAIVLTMYDGRTRLAAGVAEEVRAHFGAAVLRTVVPRSVRISEAPSYGSTVFTYDPESLGAAVYSDVARELAQQSRDVGVASTPP